MFQWIRAKLKISELEQEISNLQYSHKQQYDKLLEERTSILIEIARLNAEYSERNKLFEEWNKIHEQDKDIIASLLNAIQNKAK